MVVAVNNWSTDHFAEFSDVLKPKNIAEYLATQSWACLADRPFGQMWAQSDRQTGSVSSIVLPKDPSSPDYSRRLDESLGILAGIFDITASELAERVASVHADLFFVRVDQPMYDGTIPFSQARDLLEGIEKMIRAAATTVANPHHSHRGRLPRGVSGFMDRDVRMGHTKSGSFIVTVVARLDDLDEEEIIGQGAATESHKTLAGYPIAPGAVSAPQSAVSLPPSEELVSSAKRDDEPELSFTRRVMTTLSRSLDAAHRHVGEDTLRYMDLEQAVAAGVSLPLVQALNEIGTADTLRSLDFSFDWSQAEPAPESVPRSIVMDRTELSKLPDVQKRLQRHAAPKTETIMGQVQSLERAEPGSDLTDHGIAVISADVRGSLRRVYVPLSGRDYEWAIVAHHRKLVYTVTGTLTNEKRKWTLGGNIKPDLSFLQHVMKTEIPPPSLLRIDPPIA